MFEELWDSDDRDTAVEYFKAHWPEQLPRPHLDEVWLDTLDVSTDLEFGTHYVRFDTEDLFTQTETDAHKHLKAQGIEPVHANWALWMT